MNGDVISIYNEALDYLKKKEYLRAQEKFVKISDYTDVSEYLGEIGEHYYSIAIELYQKGEYLSCYHKVINSNIDNPRFWNESEKAQKLREAAKKSYVAQVEIEASKVFVDRGYDGVREYILGKVCDIYSETDAEEFLKSYE